MVISPRLGVDRGQVERIQQVTMEDLHEILGEWSLEPQAVGRLRPAPNLKRRLVAAFGQPPQSLWFRPSRLA